MFARKKAFTLIELLVVIAVIGILTTLAIIALQRARVNARDAKRLADVRQMQTALELYFNDNNQYPSAEEFVFGSSLVSSANGKVLMTEIPSAPEIADGACENSNYVYLSNEERSTYEILFCIGADVGDISSGYLSAKPGGIEAFTGNTALFSSDPLVRFVNAQSMSGVRIFVYSDSSYVNQVEGSPLYTDSSGRDVLNLEEGTYYFKAAKGAHHVYSSSFTYSDATVSQNIEFSLTPSTKFVSTWNTASTQITLPLEADGNYNFTVSSSNLVGSPVTITSYEDRVLNFNSSGTHTIEIEGIIEGFNFYSTPASKDSIVEISNWGPLRLGDNNGVFRSVTNLNITAEDILNLDGKNNLNMMFFASNMSSIPNINKWDLSQISSLLGMFYNSPFNDNISNWDVSNAEIMNHMFYGSQFNQDISHWNVSSATTMRSMFNQSAFNGDISNWDISSVSDISYMFYESVFNGDISNWDVSNVETMYAMFYKALFNGDISNWDVSNVINFGHMFNRSAFIGDISNWDVSNAVNISYIFYSSPFNGDISNWDVSKVENMEASFYGNSFSGDLSSWDVSSVTNFVHTFSWGTFNGDISAWDVSSAEDLTSMFYTSSFNQDISSWDLSSARNISYMFGRTPFNHDISSWDVSNVENMYRLFRDGTLDYDISSWDFANVTDMRIFENHNFSTSNYDALLISLANRPEYSISAFADNGSGSTVVTSPAHGLSNKNTVTIFGTTNYEGSYTVSDVTTDTFVINTAFVADDATGTVRQDLKSANTLMALKSQYSSAAVSARDKLINDYGWIIQDGGILP